MKAEFKAITPDSLEMEMTISMTLKKWRKLKEAIRSDYPGFEFAGKIRDMVIHAEKHFYPEKEG